MTAASFRFDCFLLDTADRRLRRDGEPVELNARYLDALCLLVENAGKLVPKDRFLEEVWRGVPVTDEALTQCIRTLRRQLGDEASRPRFIETVPKHGYRFIAPVGEDSEVGEPAKRGADARPSPLLLLGAAGTAGGGIAGLIGGIFYGLAGASEPLQPGVGALSMLLVLTALTVVVALLGGAGVSFGMAAASGSGKPLGPLTVLGGAAGGLLVGAGAKLLGLDAFNLLLGHAPRDITGAPEGALIGAAVGLSVWLGRGRLRLSVAAAGAAGAVAGAVIPLLGGQMMGGSLDLLAHSFPGSRLRLDGIGQLFGEPGFGPIAQAVTGGLEGALFGAFVAGAMTLMRKRIER